MINVGQSTQAWAEESKILCFFEETCASTNDWAKKEGFIDSQHEWLYVTNQQTQGRGRGTNTWETTTTGTQLLSTWCFQLENPAQHISAPLFGWALYKALNDEFDLNLSIKAPNDIYSGAHKIGGILLETLTQGEKHLLCVGIGLNVIEHPADIPHTSSLKEDIGFAIQENRWSAFLSNLKVTLSEAVNACTEKELSEFFTTEILEALRKWPQNQVVQVLPNGDLKLESGDLLPWTEL